MNGIPSQREAQQHAAAVTQEGSGLAPEGAAQVEPQEARNAAQQRRGQRDHAARVGRRLHAQHGGMARGDHQRHHEPEQADEAQTATQAVRAVGKVDGIDDRHRTDDADGEHDPPGRHLADAQHVAHRGQDLAAQRHAGHRRTQLHHGAIARPDGVAIIEHGHHEEQDAPHPVAQRGALPGRRRQLQQDGHGQDGPAADERDLALVGLAEVGLVHPAGAAGHRLECQHQEQGQQRSDQECRPGKRGQEGPQVKIRHGRTPERSATVTGMRRTRTRRRYPVTVRRTILRHAPKMGIQCVTQKIKIVGEPRPGPCCPVGQSTHHFCILQHFLHRRALVNREPP